MILGHPQLVLVLELVRADRPQTDSEWFEVARGGEGEAHRPGARRLLSAMILCGSYAKRRSRPPAAVAPVKGHGWKLPAIRDLEPRDVAGGQRADQRATLARLARIARNGVRRVAVG